VEVSHPSISHPFSVIGDKQEFLLHTNCLHISISAICAGKQSVANFLIENHDFKVVSLATPAAQTPPPPVINNDTGSDYNETTVVPTTTNTGKIANVEPNGGHQLLFNTVDKLLEYVTPRWREHFIITQIWNEDILEALLKRPFFLLVSVDAPIVVRWERYIKK